MKTENIYAGESPAGIVSDLSQLPDVRAAWLYRGHIHLAIRRDLVMTVRRMLKGEWILVEQMGQTVTIRSTWQTTVAANKQSEAKMRFQMKPVEQAHYEHLQHLLATYKDDGLTEFIEVRTAPDATKYHAYMEKRHPGIPFPEIYEEYYESKIPDLYVKMNQSELEEYREQERNRIRETSHTTVVEVASDMSIDNDEREEILDEVENQYLSRKANLRGVPDGLTGHLYSDERYPRNSENLRIISGCCAPPFTVPGGDEVYYRNYPSNRN